MFFEDEQLGAKRSRKPKYERQLTVPLERVNVTPDYFTDAELMAVPPGEAFTFDVESYPNYFLVSFKHVASKKIVCFEESPDEHFNRDKLQWMLWRFLLIGFKSNTYDLLVVMVACQVWADTVLLFQVTIELIVEDARPADIELKYGVIIPALNHIDLIEVAPLTASLKNYAGRLHCQRMQDLPYEPGRWLTRDEAYNVKLYNVNDLDNTELLYLEMLPQIKERETLGAEYNIDLRSRSDAQIAEAVINSELAKITSKAPKRPTIEAGTLFQYNVPSYVQFELPQLKSMLEVVRVAQFEVGKKGKVIVPKVLENMKLRIGSSVYTMRGGGLHSTEQSAAHIATDSVKLIDRDVASFYPRVILNQRLYPKHLGPNFLVVYETLVNKRLAAKKAGNKAVADALKITINGSFGKLGSKWSTLYSPDLLMQVTVTGQLTLLMLIEQCEAAGIPVVSGNTDGIVLKCPVSEREGLQAVIAAWERATGFETEETEYRAVYSRDVNNYLALKTDGKWKTKGIYSERGSALNSVLSKNPETLICSDAVQAFIGSGTPIDKTIKSCTDIRRFVAVRKVKGGAEKDGIYLGQVIRWYYAAGETGCIGYSVNGNKVPKSEGAKPLMDLPNELPADIDFDRYIAEAEEMLFDIGYKERSRMPTLFD